MVARVTNIWLFWLKFMLATISLTSLCKQKTNSVDFYRIFQNSYLPLRQNHNVSGLLLWRFLQTQAHIINFSLEVLLSFFLFSASYFACLNQETLITNELNMKKVFC